jgi:hypothetical protein
MLFNIPQFIDKEDKIVGPLTARQLGWLIGGAAVAFVFWTFLSKPVFIVVAIIIAGMTVALAFYRPNGQPLIAFVLSSFSFLSSPKMYVWKRVPEKDGPKKEVTNKIDIIIPKKELTARKIEDLSKILDNRG